MGGIITDKCNFKVVAELRNDLSEQKLKETLQKIQELQKKLSITKLENNEYCNMQKDNQEFGSVVFFFLELKKMKGCFCHLEYYDYLDNEEEIAV